MKNDLVQELGTNFIEYAAAVNSDRAIPDSKSGVKPVVRRILWGAYDTGRTSNKAHVKCARIVGDVMGSLHPHGDSSIYQALVRISQPWVMRYPLIDFHGSCGNQDGDNAAAMRYTEARLAKLAEDGMLNGLKKKNVDFMPTYDETSEEPCTLPAIFPNLLCNPNTGIGVAMACNWLPHNLIEVGQAINDYLDGKEPMLPGPDFPTGGIIINKNDIPVIMKTGHGSIKVRGKYNIEKDKIVFYEVPYGETIENILQSIGDACDKKEIEGISEVRNESNKKGLRIVIKCAKGVEPGSIINKLFVKTKLQSSISYNQVALVDKTPTELNLKDCIKIYVDHNIECICRETEFDLQKAKDRLHIVDGLLKALEDIDNIIALIKKSANSSAAKDALMQKYGFTEVQAKAILDMKLAKLANLEKIELQQEKKELEDKISEYNNILSNKDVQISILRERLAAIVKKYGDARRTELANIAIQKEEKEIAEVVPEDVVIILSQNGLIKKIPANLIKVQRKGGKGVKSADDAVMEAISTNTIDTLMFFTTKGKMYRIIADTVPNGTNVSKGTPISTLIELESDEKVIAMNSLHRKSNAKYAVFITKNGMFKKTNIQEYMKAKKSKGIAALNVREGDEVVEVTFLEEEDIILITKQGMSIRFATKDIAPVGRVALGVIGIKLNEGDEVIAALPVHKDTDAVAVFSVSGLGKKSAMSEYPTQGRGGKGNYTYRNGELAGAAMVSDEDNLLLIGNNSLICVSAKDVPLTSKTASGNILIKNNRVLSVVKI